MCAEAEWGNGGQGRAYVARLASTAAQNTHRAALGVVDDVEEALDLHAHVDEGAVVGDLGHLAPQLVVLPHLGQRCARLLLLLRLDLGLVKWGRGEVLVGG